MRVHVVVRVVELQNAKVDRDKKEGSGPRSPRLFRFGVVLAFPVKWGPGEGKSDGDTPSTTPAQPLLTIRKQGRIISKTSHACASLLKPSAKSVDCIRKNGLVILTIRGHYTVPPTSTQPTDRSESAAQCHTHISKYQHTCGRANITRPGWSWQPKTRSQERPLGGMLRAEDYHKDT